MQILIEINIYIEKKSFETKKKQRKNKPKTQTFT